jgi:hypothetical protein
VGLRHLSWNNSGGSATSEYRDKFIQLSRYAPDEVAEDERKQEHLLKDLMDPYSMHWWHTHFLHFRGCWIRLWLLNTSMFN